MENIKKISDQLHKRLFGSSRIEPPFAYRSSVLGTLKKFNLDQVPDPTPDGELPLPDWFPTAAQFFDMAAEDFLKPYTSQLVNLSNWDGVVTYPTDYDGLRPGQWMLWQDSQWKKVAQPPGHSAYCLDFETVEVEPGKAWLPTCCVAVRVLSEGSELYVWTQNFNQPQLTSTVPFSRDNIITGWNVCAYDRQFLDTEYSLELSGNTFPDLMAMHIKTRGICNQQIPMLAIANKALNGESEDGDFVPQWAFESSGNSLAAVYRLHTGQTLDKGVRDEIVKLGLPWVQQNVPRVVRYCIEDVYHTLSLWGYIYPEYSGYPNQDIMANSHNPSPVSLAGHLIATTGFIPLSPERWPTYYPNAEAAYQKVLAEIAEAILELAKISVLEHWNGDGLKQTVLDPWEHQLDWTPVKPKGRKSKLPKWYHELTKGVTVNKRVVPFILKMRWMGEPLKYSDKDGWHTASERIPHPEDSKKRLTHIFAKANKASLTNGQFSAALDDLQAVIDAVNSIVIWKSMRKRVKALKVELMRDTPIGSPQIPMMVPNILPHGTISGRQASKDIHVFSHPKPHSIGTGFLTNIQALPGYHEVYIDFDSQELKLVAYAGCEALGFVGSTPLSVIVEVGQAHNKTDFHSMNMKLMQCDNRTLVKNCGYAWCYMVGHETQTKTILKANPAMGEASARQLELTGRAGFVGVKAGGRFSGGTASDSFNILTQRANAKPLTTLFGGVKLTKALSGNPDYLTTRFNAVIQATGAVMLDHILVGTTYMVKRYNINARYMMSRHDEWVFHTKDEDIMKMAWAMQTVHKAVWAKLMYELCLDTLSLNCAYASSVAVSKNYMKNPNSATITPDQPTGVAEGRSILKEEIIEYLRASENGCP